MGKRCSLLMFPDVTQKEKSMPARPTPRRPMIVYILLALPFVGLMWPAFYSSDAPRLGNIPFFYWYQFAWVFGSALCTGAAYLVEQRHGR